MKLDVNTLRYLTHDEWRVLTAVEIGQKNVRSKRATGSNADALHRRVSQRHRTSHSCSPKEAYVCSMKLYQRRS